MILLFDIGNTRIKYALLHGELIVAGKSSHYVEGMALDPFLAEISDTPVAIYLASVGGRAITEQLISCCRARWEITPVLLSSSQECGGVSNGYTCAQTLGVDRWAAIVGAYQLVKQAVLVIDCGTACTADLVDGEGRHLGGAIIPGMQMMRDSLDAGTTGVGKSSEAIKVDGWGRATDGCIELGVTSSLVAFIEKMTAHATTTVGGEVIVLLTGGDAPKLLQILKPDARYEKELVFLGMAGMVAQKGE
jgi:type III pantothenate kinase